jgi:hypothetical protein
MSIDFKDWLVTPKHMRSDFPFSLSLDQKITIFFERVDGWQLSIADQIVNGIKDKNGKIIHFPLPDSAYAVLSIVWSFFEMIAKYESGYIGIDKCRFYFKKGVRSVFPDLEKEYSQPLVDEVLNVLYDWVRCRLYHCGFTDPKVFVRNDIRVASMVLTKQKKLIVNPELLVPALRKHLEEYIERLRAVGNIQLRKNFEKRFDFENALID